MWVFLALVKKTKHMPFNLSEWLFDCVLSEYEF